MAKKTNGSPWQTISLSPLSGGLDIRSRPADIPAGWFRYKSNFSMTPSGKLCRRQGFAKAFSKSGYNNQDLHHQGGTRESITMLYENTWADGSRFLFAGTLSRLYTLDETVGDWTTITTGKGSGTSVFRAATLHDIITFVNGVDDVLQYQKGTGVMPPNADLVFLQLTAPRFTIMFNGFIFVMNDVEGGIRNTSRVRWCDLNDPTTWISPQDVPTADNLAGFQDLDYGDEILAAGVLLGALYIFTRRAIWRCTVGALQSGQTFQFTRVYYEPDNQMGCLVFPYTLTSDGQNFWYMSRDAIYKYNPYMVAPDRKESDGNDWLYRASGAIYTFATSAINSDLCNLPCACFVPITRELYFSWPSGTHTQNNWSLVAQVDQRTADVVDHGFSSIKNYREAPAGVGLCNEVQSLLAASAADYCIKDLGVGVFYREMAVLDPGGVSVDLPTPATYVTVGYYSELKGMIPTGFFDREKLIREALLDDDTNFQDVPCNVRMQLGTSYNLTDPLDMDDFCSPLWNNLGTRPLACPDALKLSQMKAMNLRQSDAIRWKMLYQGKFLFFWVKIENPDGSPAIGGDTCFQRLDFDLLGMPKP